MLKVVDAKNWIKGDYVPVASIKIKPSQIENLFNFKFKEGYEDGLGDSKWQILELPNGNRFVFEYLLSSPDKSTSILCVNNSENTLKEVFDLLNITMNDVTWIRGDITLYDEIDVMPKNAELPRSWLMWLLLPLSYLTVYFLYLNFSTQTSSLSNFKLFIILMPFILIALGVTVSIISPGRGWWGLRLISFMVFIGYISYFIDQFIINPSALTVFVRSSANAFNAMLGMLLIGFPSLAYTFWGSVLGRLGHKNQIKVTKSDRNTLILMRMVLLLSSLLLIGSFFVYLYQFMFS